MKKLIFALFLTISVLSVTANNRVSSNVPKINTETQQVPSAAIPKLVLRRISVSLSCGISFEANFPDTWTTTQIVNWVMNADNQLCGGGVIGA